MVSHERIEEFICQYPVYQYAFFSPEDICFIIPYKSFNLSVFCDFHPLNLYIWGINRMNG